MQLLSTITQPVEKVFLSIYNHQNMYTLALLRYKYLMSNDCVYHYSIEPIVYKRGGEGSLGQRKTITCF